MAIDAVVFDWGGTLTDGWLSEAELLDLWRLAALHLAEETGRPDTVDELAERLWAVELAAWDRAIASGRSFRIAELLDEATRALGLDVGTAVLDEAARRHLDGWTRHVHHRDEAAEVLSALRAQGLRIGLLSNTHWPRHVHEHFLARDGLDGLIDVRCYTSELEHLKPDPAAFGVVLAELGVEPEHAVFVGDRPVDDIGGAAAVGMRTVRLTDNDHVVPAWVTAGAELPDLVGLPGLIAGWRSSRFV
jgi:putative hydrolase of the HAD superfamily